MRLSQLETTLHDTVQAAPSVMSSDDDWVADVARPAIGTDLSRFARLPPRFTRTRGHAVSAAAGASLSPSESGEVSCVETFFFFFAFNGLREFRSIPLGVSHKLQRELGFLTLFYSVQ